MYKQLIIALSGKKQAGKNTATNYIAGLYLKRTKHIKDFKLNEIGELCFTKNDHWCLLKEGEFNSTFNDTDIKLYSFADYLKEFCMDVFGLTYEQCYGTDEQKNTLTDLYWIDMPTDNAFPDGVGEYPVDLKMKARQVLQYFGTDIIRSMFGDAWVNATINKIRREKPRVAIITDGRFENEINAINKINGKTIRLTRDISKGKDTHFSEKALDDFPLKDYSLVIDNRKMSIDEQCEALSPHIDSCLNNLFGNKCR